MLDTPGWVGGRLYWIHYGLDRPTFESRQASYMFLFSKYSESLPSPNVLLFIGHRCPFPGVKRSV